MITGPSIGPAMVLTVLMRWPRLMVVGAAGGVGTFAYNHVDMPSAIASIEVAKPQQTMRDSAGARTAGGNLNPASISAATAFVTAPVGVDGDLPGADYVLVPLAAFPAASTPK